MSTLYTTTLTWVRGEPPNKDRRYLAIFCINHNGVNTCWPCLTYYDSLLDDWWNSEGPGFGAMACHAELDLLDLTAVMKGQVL